jgi:hypothetical protein
MLLLDVISYLFSACFYLFVICVLFSCSLCCLRNWAYGFGARTLIINGLNYYTHWRGMN